MAVLFWGTLPILLGAEFLKFHTCVDSNQRMQHKVPIYSSASHATYLGVCPIISSVICYSKGIVEIMSTTDLHLYKFIFVIYTVLFQ